MRVKELTWYPPVQIQIVHTNCFSYERAGREGCRGTSRLLFLRRRSICLQSKEKPLPYQCEQLVSRQLIFILLRLVGCAYIFHSHYSTQQRKSSCSWNSCLGLAEGSGTQKHFLKDPEHTGLPSRDWEVPATMLVSSRKKWSFILITSH